MLLGMRWGPFFALSLAAYLGLNLLFACGYWLLGPGALSEQPVGAAERFMAAFFSACRPSGPLASGTCIPSPWPPTPW
ncbi:hypothetical protein [Deinococcus multiflagellatus]|uniref:Uncharacterized protein n=1 Tax=Deinococcus multiflagellatus TaxID=1656887 RepID=A0ABW1ZGL6_9DEIO